MFFCGREAEKGRWDYYYIGVGSVGRLLHRDAIWSDDTCEPYRHFFNVLARPTEGVLQQHETIYRFHPDWEARAIAPYVEFDPAETSFNLDKPLHVATYDRRRDAIERWRDEDDRVHDLAKLILPSAPTRRGLRSTSIQRPHPKMNLAEQAERAGGFDALRVRLLRLVGD